MFSEGWNSLLALAFLNGYINVLPFLEKFSQIEKVIKRKSLTRFLKQRNNCFFARPNSVSVFF